MTEIQWSAWADCPGPAAIIKLSLMWRWVGAGVFLCHELYLISLLDPSHGRESQPCFVVSCALPRVWSKLGRDNRRWVVLWIAYIVNLLKIRSWYFDHSNLKELDALFYNWWLQTHPHQGTMFWAFSEKVTVTESWTIFSFCLMLLLNLCFQRCLCFLFHSLCLWFVVRLITTFQFLYDLTLLLFLFWTLPTILLCLWVWEPVPWKCLICNNNPHKNRREQV